jgi:hypothetical protein
LASTTLQKSEEERVSWQSSMLFITITARKADKVQEIEIAINPMSTLQS